MCEKPQKEILPRVGTRNIDQPPPVPATHFLSSWTLVTFWEDRCSGNQEVLICVINPLRMCIYIYILAVAVAFLEKDCHPGSKLSGELKVWVKLAGVHPFGVWTGVAK